MKYLAIDYGRKRIGLALGEMIPYGAGVVSGEDHTAAMEKIAKISTENEVGAIVVGLPIRSQGELGTLAEEIKIFSEKLSTKLNLPLYFEEEQFTSSEAEAELKERFSGKLEPGKVDELAAILILERFFEKINR